MEGRTVALHTVWIRIGKWERSAALHRTRRSGDPDGEAYRE